MQILCFILLLCIGLDDLELVMLTRLALEF